MMPKINIEQLYQQQQQQQKQYPLRDWHEEDDQTIHFSSNAAQSSPGGEVDKVVCEKVNALTSEERRLALHELHGVAGDFRLDDKDGVCKKMQETARFSRMITGADGSPYQTALELDSDYVERIQQRCLAADRYDSNQAASRLVSFFAFKKELFGGSSLARDIKLDDLSVTDKQALRRGRVQILQQTDQSGRLVCLVTTNETGKAHSVESWFRMLYYVIMASLGESTAQTRGIVCVLYPNGQNRLLRSLAERFAAMWAMLPVRLAAMHICCNTAVGHHFESAMSQSMDGHQLSRLRRHFGSYHECADRLATFGIPKRLLPFDTQDGRLDFRDHKICLHNMKPQDETNPKDSAAPEDLRVTSCKLTTPVDAVIPGPMDILMGRGSHMRKSMGHSLFRSLLEKHRSTYETSARYQKTKVVQQVVDELKTSGCRFLKPTTTEASTTPLFGCLEECNEVELREKISHAFRNMRLPRRKRAPGEKKGIEENCGSSSSDDSSC